MHQLSTAGKGLHPVADRFPPWLSCESCNAATLRRFLPCIYGSHHYNIERATGIVAEHILSVVRRCAWGGHPWGEWFNLWSQLVHCLWGLPAVWMLKRLLCSPWERLSSWIMILRSSVLLSSIMLVMANQPLYSKIFPRKCLLMGPSSVNSSWSSGGSAENCSKIAFPPWQQILWLSLNFFCLTKVANKY